MQPCRELAIQALAQRRAAEYGQRAFTQQIAVATHAEVGRDGAVGDDQIEPAHRQFGHQRRERAFTTYQPARALEVQCGLDQAVHDRFWHRVRDADTKWQPASLRPVTQGFDDLIAEREDFIGVAEDALAGFGHFQPPPDAAEQRAPQTGFEARELGADCVWCDIEQLARGGDGADPAHHPEVTQVLVVEISHRGFIQKIDHSSKDTRLFKGMTHR